MEKLNTLAIGGYFGLELSKTNNLFIDYDELIMINSARNCLEYILQLRKYNYLYVPYFTCDVILEPLKKLGISYEFYDVNDKLEPIFDQNKIQKNEGFLYTNYFGIKDKYLKNSASKIPNLIVDNAQALFSKPIKNIDTFYSPRKFVGVADGGFLSINEKLSEKFEQDVSYKRMVHLLKRIDLSAEAGYKDFCINDDSLKNQPIKLISKLTEEILSNVNFSEIKKKRIENFNFLHNALKELNLLKFEINEDVVPMVYPFRSRNLELSTKLIENKIYCAKYWPNVLDWCSPQENSYKLTQEIIPLPIDQRYSPLDMAKILKYV